MGLIARILSFTRDTRSGVTIADVKADPGGGANLTAEHVGPPGDDSRPLPGDYVAISEAAGKGRKTAIGYFDPENAAISEPGEKRLYSRDPDTGFIVSEVWLKNDGEITVSNDAGSFTLKPDGEVIANGAKITVAGDFVTASGISFLTHIHPTTTLGAPTGPAQSPPPPPV